MRIFALQGGNGENTGTPSFTHSPKGALTTLVCGLTASAFLAPAALSQDRGKTIEAGQETPMAVETVVTATRIGVGLPGASVTVIDAEEIKESPAKSLPELLGLEAGIQNRDLFGGTRGARATVDMRGFGAVGKQNTLILLDGRRLNDIDVAAIDFANIPIDSIERIEIIRGNAGAVLYGDGAVGGVVNIVTKRSSKQPTGASADVALGTTDGGGGPYRESNVSASHSAGPFSVSAYGTFIKTPGFRDNNDLIQHNLDGELRHAAEAGDVFVKLSLDKQTLGLPGARLVDEGTGVNLLKTDPRGTATPLDKALQSGISLTLGMTRRLTGDVQLIIDMGGRKKDQDASIIDNTGGGFNQIIDTELTTWSFTPRLNADYEIAGFDVNSIVGIDYYYADYTSDRQRNRDEAPIHRYNARQHTVGLYAQNTLAVTADTDAHLGLRLQYLDVHAGDTFDAGAPGAFGSGLKSLTETQWHYAANFGLEHRLTDAVTVFGRVGRSLRLPTIDERISTVDPLSFGLGTQTSKDVEGGVRYASGPLDVQSSAYAMETRNEIRFDPSLGPFGFGRNRNLDPIRRIGVETSASYRVTDTLRLKGNLTFTDAQFIDGPFEGNDVPLVAPWTASATLFWDIWKERLKLAVTAIYVDANRLENDEPNLSTKIPDHYLVDMKLSGAYGPATWSAEVHNLFDKDYFNYGVSSTTNPQRFNTYPQPGRTFLVRAGVEF